MLIERIKTIVHFKGAETTRVLYLTGMMGAGKTTVAEAMSVKSRALIIPEFLSPIPRFVVQTRSDDPLEQKVTAQLWTLNQHSEKNSLINNSRGQIIVDRTWLDSIFYSTIYGDETTERVMEKVEEHEWYPGLYVCVIATPDIVKGRLVSKIGMTDQLWEESWRSFVVNLHSSVYEIANRAEIPIIDTSNLSLEDTTEAIERILQT